MAVLCGEWIFDFLRDVFDRNQSLKVLVFVHDQQLLDPVLVQEPLSFLQRCAHRNRDEILLRHDFADREVKSCFEAQIAVRQNAHQPPVFRDWNSRYLVMSHQLNSVFDFVVGRHRDRIDDQAALGSLHLVDFGRLFVDRHIPVDDSDAALLGKRDGQSGFGDGIHGSADDRDIQFKAPGEPGIGSSFGGQDVRFERNNQDVVEGISVA